MSTEANFSAPVLVMRVRNFNWQAGGSAGISFASDSSEAEQNWQFDLNGTRAVRSVLASSNQRVGRMACITFFFCLRRADVWLIKKETMGSMGGKMISEMRKQTKAKKVQQSAVI